MQGLGLPFCGNHANLQNVLLGDVGVGGSSGSLAGVFLGSVIALSLHGSVVLSSAEMFATLFVPAVVGFVAGAMIHNRRRLDALSRQSPEARLSRQALVGRAEDIARYSGAAAPSAQVFAASTNTSLDPQGLGFQ